MFEELQELGDEDVERSVERVRVQTLGGVLADLLQRAESSLQVHTNKDYSSFT